MPLASFSTTGGAIAVDIVAAASGVTNRVLGIEATATGTGTVIFKNGTTVVHKMTSPGEAHMAPSDLWEFPAANASNTAITVTPSDAAIVVSGSVNYQKVPV